VYVETVDVLVQCADLGQLIEQNKNTMSTGYDSASKVWSGVEIVAQLELLGLTAALFAELRVSRHLPLIIPVVMKKPKIYTVTTSQQSAFPLYLNKAF